jgi:threonine/homoserine/homoserine lactone efflux protein
MSLEFVITSLIVILTPGTGVIYTIATAMGRGRSAGMAAAFGCTLGIVPHIAASTLGLAAIVHTSAVLFQILKFCGAAYLLYLAWQTLKAVGPLQISAREVPAKRARDTIATGFLINILNPKLSVFFLAFLPQFVAPGDPSQVMGQMAYLGGAFMAMTLAVFIVYCAFAAELGRRVLGSETVLLWMRRTVAATFAGFGLRLALTDR